MRTVSMAVFCLLIAPVWAATQAEAQQAKFRCARIKRTWKLARVVPGLHMRRDLVFGKAPHRIGEGRAVGLQFGVHVRFSRR